MSNSPENDPIAHAAKFIAIFAIIPAMIGTMLMWLGVTAQLPIWIRYNGFVIAIVLLAVAAGVYKRSIAAAYLGITLFIIAIIGVAIHVLTGHGAKASSLFILIMLFSWPIIKLQNAVRAMRAEGNHVPENEHV